MDSCRRGFSPMRHKELWGQRGGWGSLRLRVSAVLDGSHGTHLSHIRRAYRLSCPAMVLAP